MSANNGCSPGSRERSAWVDRLAGSPEDSACWAEFDLLDEVERGAIAVQLKERVDELVRSDPPRALEVAEALGRAARHSQGSRALAARGLAMAKHVNGRAQEALGDYLEAARLHAVAGDELELGRVHRSLVDVYQMSGDSDEALRSAALAREIFERHGEARLLAQLEANLGNVYVRLDDYSTARVHYSEACRRFGELNDELSLAVAGYNLGIVEASAHALPQARRAFQGAALVFADKGMRVHAADCDYMLAYLEGCRGHFGRAIQGLEQAREQYADCGKPSGSPLCDLDLAEIYFRIDACRDAREHAEQAMQGFKALEMDYEFAKASLFAGLALARLGETRSALDAMTAAQGLFTKLSNRAWPAVLDIHRSVVEIDSSKGSGAEASEAAAQRLRAAREALHGQGLKLWSDLATIALGHLWMNRGEASAAEEELVRLADGSSRRTGLDALVTVEQHMLQAEVHRARGDHAGAVAELREAVAAIESSWSNVPGTDVRTAFFRTRHSAFARLAYLLGGQTGGASEAFEVLERGRLRSLRDAGRETRRGGAVDEARAHLDWLLGRQLDEQLGSATGDHELAGRPVTEEQILDAQREVARLSRVRDGDLPAASRMQALVPRLSKLLDPDEALVTWILTDREACAFVLDPSGVSSFELETHDRSLRALADRLWFQMHKFELGAAYRDRHQDRLVASANLILDELGERMLAPLHEALEPKRRLILVPYGALHGLPIHAARLRGRPLVASHDVGYALSGYQLLKSREDRAAPAEGEVTMVAGDAHSLPAIARELERLQAAFPKARFLNPRELQDHLRSERPKRGLLHVSAHGAFQMNHPVFSGVRIGDAFLTAHDIAALQLPYEVVNLSGCETGRVGHAEGEELFGLNRAFLGAGARCVVSSFWPVDDGDCADLMGRFYEHLGGGRDVSSALSLAQREQLQLAPNPFTWASFACFGDPHARLAPHTVETAP